MLSFIISILIIVAILYFIFATYNRVIYVKNMADNAESTIDVMLKKRYDLIPNLVETVKSYMKHESELLSKITDLRAQGLKPDLDTEDKVKIDRELNSALSQFNINVEAYPDLKANQNFMMLQQSLSETEEQLAAARNGFNASVTVLNNTVEMIPTNIFASFMNIKQRKLFEAPIEEQKTPNVAKLFK